MTDKAALGGRQLGALNRQKFKAWLDTVDYIPKNPHTGGAHLTELERILGIDRNSFYTNPGLRKMLEEAIEKKGLRPIQTKEKVSGDSDDGYVQYLEGRVRTLEQQLDAKKAEANELTEKLKRFQAMERLMLTTGRLPR